MMYSPQRKILWFAIISRIVVLIFQFIFNILCPDHDADAFKGPISNSEQVSLCDNIITLLFSGLSRWDGEYFIHIAKYGYVYENTLAFYPLYPILIRIIAIPIQKIFFVLNFNSSLILAAVLINFVCFIKSAIIFYDLSKIVLRDKNISYKATILYCINPASIFFSAIYTESLFVYLSYYSMLRSIKLDPYVSFPIALSILTRSNGMVNIGFPIYFRLKSLFHSFLTKHPNFSLKTLSKFMYEITTLKSICVICNIIIISMVPFILLQIHNYIMFCIPNSNYMFTSEHIINYGIKNNLVIAGTNNSEWCNLKIPVAYAYIQKKYWNVGFLNYYEVKQIPNFVLAIPILYIMITCIKEYFLEHKRYFCTLGFIQNFKSKKEIKTKKYPMEMLVFVVHGLFLTVFCILFIHIQVSTRLICSASPLIYWYCALTYTSDSNNDTAYESEENACSKWKVFFFKQRKYSLQDKLILLYFLGYTGIGCIMFSNFLPWT
nr:PREDICTED: GPI mannosyltransferase 2 [Megachile rotundata]